MVTRRIDDSKYLKFRLLLLVFLFLLCFEGIHGRTGFSKEYLIFDKLHLEDTVLCSEIIRTSVDGILVEARCLVSADNPRRGGTSASCWGVGIRDIVSNRSLEVDLRRITDYIDDINGGRRLRLTFRLLSNVLTSTLFEADLEKNVSLTGGENTLILSFDNDSCRIMVGDRTPVPVYSAPQPFGLPESFEAYFKGSGKVTPSLCVLEVKPSQSNLLKSTVDLKDLASGKLFSKNRIDGVWKYLDRENNTDYARPGGSYVFATITDTTGVSTEIIYLGGAQVADDKWQPGMIKGKLLKTPFFNHYDLRWVAANLEWLSGEMFADLSEDGNVLTLSFPELKSKMRFQRLPLSALEYEW